MHGKNRIDQVGGFCKRPLTLAIQGGQVDAINNSDDIIEFFQTRPNNSSVKTHYIKLDATDMKTKFHGNMKYETLTGISSTVRLDHQANSNSMQLSKRLCSCKSFQHTANCEADTEEYVFEPWLERDELEESEEDITDGENEDGEDDSDSESLEDEILDTDSEDDSSWSFSDDEEENEDPEVTMIDD